MIYAIKIDVTKIEKARLFEGKNGAKYLDAVMIETPDNQHGNSHMIVQSVTKEEREQGIRGPILGNAKIIGGGQAPRSTRTAPASSEPASDGCPF